VRVKQLVTSHPPGPVGVTSASASSLETSYCALLHFPSKICNKHTSNYGVTKELRKSLHFSKFNNLKIFCPPFWGLWGSCPLFSKLLRSSPGSTLRFPPTSPLRHPEKIPTKKSKTQDVLYLPDYYM